MRAFRLSLRSQVSHRAMIRSNTLYEIEARRRERLNDWFDKNRPTVETTVLT